jgi:hypothetical protein
MELQDKLVEDREAAHAELSQREDVEARNAEELPEPVVEAVAEAGAKMRGQLLGAIRMLLDGETLSVSQLHVPQREAGALEALQTAVRGRGSLGEIVYASDRRDLLEQALAVLQPDLVHAQDQSVRELVAQFTDLTERVGELRHTLADLEDSQDELLEAHQKAVLDKPLDDAGDKPKPPPVPSDPDAPRPPTSLTGPEGPELREPAKPATTLTGPELKEPAKPPTSLIGPELKAPPRPASTLDGPELAPEPAAVSSLGADATTDATADDKTADAKSPKAKGSWWKKPFG